MDFEYDWIEQEIKEQDLSLGDGWHEPISVNLNSRYDNN